ncbi:MAG: universal stress protein, partial [Bacteroidetes bacterium]|nr:universal stress protein [Bacteroidota bacterium]
MKKNIILVPTDFSEVADHALEHAIQVAKTFNNDIAILHVTDEGMLGGLFQKNSYNDLVKDAIQAKLDKCVEKCKQSGIDATTQVKSGKIYKTVTETADELGCDSIIMGTHGASGLETFIGSNASKVISYSNVPVVVVKEESSSKASYKSIVMPIDLTIESKQKVTWAIRLAKQYNSTIHLINDKKSDPFLVTHINAQRVQIASLLKENGVAYTEKEIDGGSVAQQVLNYAEAINADLILIMS